MTAAVEPEELRVPLGLIVPPDAAMRETMSDEGLESLARSLRDLGQLENIGLVRVSDRFRVSFGHRRTVAAAIAGLTHLRALVWPEGAADEQAMKVAENAEQEKVNPAAEATYYHGLLASRCGGDVDKLAALVRRPLSRVLDRLDLLRGWPEVLEALRTKQIPLAVAQALNKVKDAGYLRLFLADAIRDGASARSVRVWRQDLERTLRIQAVAREAGVTSEAPAPIASYENLDACPLCHSADDQHDMAYMKVHRSCREVFARQQREPRGAGQ